MNLHYASLHGLGSDQTDCANGNADACARYYASQYVQAPSVQTANPGIVNSGSGGGVANTTSNASCPYNPPGAQPPTPYGNDPLAYSNDPAVFIQPAYAKALNLNMARQAANQNNMLAYQQYTADWHNYVANSCTGRAPSAPVYQQVTDSQFNQYWDALTNGGTGFNSTVTPQAYGIPGGQGGSNVPYNPAPSYGGVPVPKPANSTPGSIATPPIKSTPVTPPPSGPANNSNTSSSTSNSTGSSGTSSQNQSTVSSQPAPANTNPPASTGMDTKTMLLIGGAAIAAIVLLRG